MFESFIKLGIGDRLTLCDILRRSHRVTIEAYQIARASTLERNGVLVITNIQYDKDEVTSHSLVSTSRGCRIIVQITIVGIKGQARTIFIGHRVGTGLWLRYTSSISLAIDKVGRHFLVIKLQYITESAITLQVVRIVIHHPSILRACQHLACILQIFCGTNGSRLVEDVVLILQTG